MIAFILFIGSVCFAHVPEYGTIASRAAEQHGRGAYQIEQEVSYRKDADTFAVKETWTVLGEGNLRVSLEGRGPLRGLVRGTILYDGGTRAMITDASVRTSRLGEDWLEPLFHFRYGKWFRQRLVTLKVTPPESLQDRPPLNHEGPPNYERPTFLRPGRAGGTLAIAIGAPPSSGSAPTVWMEQDQFVLRKYLAANQVVLKADEYAVHKSDPKSTTETGLHLPRVRTYTFGKYEVTVTTLAVKPLGKQTPADARFRTASLKPATDAVKLPDVEGLNEFYSRFR